MAKRALRCIWVAVGLVAGGTTLIAQDSKENHISLDELGGSTELWQLTDSEFGDKWCKPPEETDDEKKDSIKKKIEAVIKSGDDDKEEDAPNTRIFEWLSEAKNAARYQGTTSTMRIEEGTLIREKKKGATLGELPVGETIVRFKEGTVSMVEFSIYNRGDDGDMGKFEFEKLLKDSAALAEKIAGVRGSKGSGAASAARAQRLIYRGKDTYYQLEYSFQRKNQFGRFAGEFIKLKLAPGAAGGLLAGAEKSKLASRGSLKDRVVKRDTGDVLIPTVPMVDQGQKGYCAVASAERVMRYYGLEVDQHEMAQIAGSSAARGTDSSFMIEALEKVAGRLRVRVRTEFEIDDRDFDSILKKYNRSAKKTMATEPIVIPRGRILNPVYLLHEGHPETLKAARADGAKYDRFKTSVMQHIDTGVPLLWSLYLGIFPEEDIPQPSGGHMRCIIGYNKKTDELIYSDSWGAGHEEKRMAFDKAFTMTLGLRYMVPSR